MRSFVRHLLISLLLICVFAINSFPQENSGAARYDIGSPSLSDLWVDPVSGDDDNSGASRSQALRSVNAAWNMIPQGRSLTQGIRIMLAAGNYSAESLPNYWESRYGTYQAPIILQAADGPGTAVFRGGINLFDLRYVYMIDFDILPTHGGDAWHCEKCDHILVRNMRMSGLDGTQRVAQETVKANQSSYLFFEDNDIGGANDNASDFVAVQHGHFLGNYIHDADDWCQYLKGGSAYFLVEGNRYANCGTGGFTAGQGTGFEFMTSPWLHYEAYEIKFINNVIQNTDGAGIGVNGGYNILMAHNTMYRVGRRSHAIEVVFGLRGCDGDTARCNANRAAGGWGPSSRDEEPIPNRNVFIFNNILYNPAGFQSSSEQFAIYAPRTPSAGSNVPSPARTDVNLQIRGNLIWNGAPDLPLGIGSEERGCQDSNTTCNQSQLLADNVINVIEPQFLDVASGDFRPLTSGNIFGVSAAVIPAFNGGDQPTQPAVPGGNLENTVGFDRGGSARNGSVVGAYISADSPIGDRPGSSPGGGGGGGDGGGNPIDPSAPSISTTKVTAKLDHNRIVVSVRANVVDSDGVSSVTATISDAKSRSLASLSLRTRRASIYQAKGVLKRVNKLKRVIVNINAVDSIGHTNSSTIRAKVVR